MRDKWKLLWVALGVLMCGHAIGGEPSKNVMPPSFDFDSNPAEVLDSYPLGVINEVQAFAHHGAAVRKVTLPNGNRGWLYKAGEAVGVPSIYLLEFSTDGVVIDVLHKDHRYKQGHSALQYQYLRHVEAELRTPGPGPGM